MPQLPGAGAASTSTEVITRGHGVVTQGGAARPRQRRVPRRIDLEYVTRLIFAPLVLMTVWRYSFDFCGAGEARSRRLHRAAPGSSPARAAGRRDRARLARRLARLIPSAAPSSYEDIRVMPSPHLHRRRSLILLDAAAARCRRRLPRRAASREDDTRPVHAVKVTVDGGGRRRRLHRRCAGALGERAGLPGAGQDRARMVEVGRRWRPARCWRAWTRATSSFNVEAAKQQLVAAHSDFTGRPRMSSGALHDLIEKGFVSAAEYDRTQDHLRHGSRAARAGDRAARA